MSILTRTAWLTLGAALTLAPKSVGATEWYVAPNGTPNGQGTREAPWDIASALNGTQKVGPGDTIYLLNGTYWRRPQELFEVKLVGTPEKPIHVRPAPGERAIIDGGLAVMPPTAYVWIWDLEIFVSEPNPMKPIGPGSHPEEFKRPWGGLHIHGGDHCKFINLVIHHARQGISWWVGSKDSEVHGCLIYDNGWPATDRGHGHAIYTQNDEGVKVISDCIMSGGYSYTMHAYGSERAYVNNYLAEGNICYGKAGTFLIGGGRPSHGIRVLNNILYGAPMRIGYGAENEDCEVRHNIIVNATLTIEKYKKVTEEGNLILGKDDPRPAGATVILRPNKYDPNRANLAILNWEQKPTVAVDPGNFLKPGDYYLLMDPRDFFGMPLLRGTYDGKPIQVPIQGEFAAFVMLRVP